MPRREEREEQLGTIMTNIVSIGNGTTGRVYEYCIQMENNTKCRGLLDYMHSFIHVAVLDIHKVKTQCLDRD